MEDEEIRAKFEEIKGMLADVLVTLISFGLLTGIVKPEIPSGGDKKTEVEN